MHHCTELPQSELQHDAVQCPAGISCITGRNILVGWFGGLVVNARVGGTSQINFPPTTTIPLFLINQLWIRFRMPFNISSLDVFETTQYRKSRAVSAVITRYI